MRTHIVLRNMASDIKTSKMSNSSRKFSKLHPERCRSEEMCLWKELEG